MVSNSSAPIAKNAPTHQLTNSPSHHLRYGENPHQTATFHGDLSALFDQLHGKQLSYNNLVDVDAAVALMREFAGGPPACAILKHTNACGVAQAPTLAQAYANALACDPVSAFGGVIVVNEEVDAATATELNQLFFEVLIAPSFAPDALPILQSKKNRILLRQKPVEFPTKLVKTLLNGLIEQDADLTTETAADFRTVTQSAPTAEEVAALEFAGKICKHTKSNTIVLARPGQLLASGVGQTSRVDALRQAIEKASSFGFDLHGAVMASDAFFPFPDCVEIAGAAGIRAVVQPGGSIKDADSIAACDELRHGHGADWSATFQALERVPRSSSFARMLPVRRLLNQPNDSPGQHTSEAGASRYSAYPPPKPPYLYVLFCPPPRRAYPTIATNSMGFFNFLTSDIAIDLGTANTLIIHNDKIVVDEPSIIAKDRTTNKVIAVGRQAQQMHEKTHDNIRTIRPLKDGVIADFHAAEEMIKGMIKMIDTRNRLFQPSHRMVICIPSGITEVEKRAVRDSAEHAGAKEVWMIQEPMAAAIGIGIDVEQPVGSMIIDIGGGTTEIAVIALSGIVCDQSIKTCRRRFQRRTFWITCAASTIC